MLADKVVKLNNTKVYDQIKKYLTKQSYNSKGTEVAYEGDIRVFFKTVKNKDIEYLTQDDIQITLDDFEDFIQYFYQNKLYENKTINRKVSAVKGLLKYLAAKKLVNDVSYFELVNSLPEKKNSYGIFQLSEVFDLAELALTEKYKAKEKRLLILFALDTCIRQSAILSLKWSAFREVEDRVLVEGVDKGNQEFRQSIAKEFYRELLTIKSDSELVFNGVTKDMIFNLIKRYKKQFNIPDERKLVFHSIRKAGGTFRYRVTGDIFEAKKALNHKSIVTTQIYIEDEDYGALGAVSSKGKLNEELYKEVDHETLVKAIESLSTNQKFMLNMKINELIRNIKE